MNIDTLGGRKALSGLVVLIVGVASVALKGDVPANLLQLLQVVFGAFVVGNVGEHIAGSVVARSAGSNQQQLTETIDTVEELAAHIKERGGATEALLAEVSGQQKQLIETAQVTQQGIATIVQMAIGAQAPQASSQAARNRAALNTMAE